MTSEQLLKVEILRACNGDFHAAERAFGWIQAQPDANTKTAEVWHVERVADGKHLFVSVCQSHHGADSLALSLGESSDNSCIRVTGPHQHTVPT